MSTINKLSIDGIRSFASGDPQVIAFKKPLTLIVGSNGAGKTTVIECIKMALTGELPPDAARGKNFIHDPKVNQGQETKAAIKLQFHTVNKKKCTVARQFSLAYKSRKEDAAASYSMSSTSLHTVNEHGKKCIISQRCVDVDKVVPQHMGISKAILENVIFVHQEEANWPLRESKVLKQKFDDIFAATRYSKALEAIKKLRKTKMDEMKDEKIVLAEKKGLVTARQDLHKRIKQQENNIQEMDDDLAESARDLEFNKEELAKLQAVKDQYEECGSKISEFKVRRDEVIKAREQVRETIDQNGGEYLGTEDDSKLRKWRDQLHRDTDNNQSDISARENKIEQLHVELGEKERFLTEKTRERILLESEINKHESDIHQRLTGVGELAEQLAQPAGADILTTQQRCFEDVKHRERKLYAAKESHREELDKCRQKLSELKNNLRQSESKIKELESDEMNDREELQLLTNKLQQWQSMSPGNVQKLQQAITNLQQQHRESQRQLDAYKDQIEGKQDEERQAKREKDKLKAELDTQVYQQQSVVKVSSLAAQQKQVAESVERQLQEIRNIVRAISEEGRQAAADSNTDTLGQFIQSFVQSSDSAATAARNRHSASQANREQLNNRIQTLQQQENEYSKVYSGKAKTVAKARKTMHESNDSPWPELIAARRDKIRQLEMQSEFNKAAAVVYKEFLDKAESFAPPCHGCPLCDRAFQDNYAFTQFKEKLENIRDNNSVTAYDDEIETAKKLLQFCEKKEPVWREMKTLEKELSTTQAELESERQNFANIEDEEAAAREELSKCERQKSDADQLKIKWSAAEQQQRNLADLDRKLQREKGNMHGGSAERSMESIAMETKQAEKRTDEIADQIRRLFEQQSKDQESLRLLSTTISDKQGQLHDAEREKVERKMSEKRISEIQTRDLERQRKLKENQQQVRDYSSRLPSIQAEAAQLVQRHAEEEGAMERQISDWRTRVKELQTLSDAIDRFKRQHPPDELQEMDAILVQKKQDQQTIQGKISELQEEIQGLRETGAERNQMLRNMQDVIQFREKEAQINDINAAITRVDEERATIAPQRNWDAKFAELEKKVQKGLSIKGHAQGQKDQCLAELKKLQEEIQRFKNADKEYRNLLITVKTLGLGCADLEKYNQALDKALVAYHAEKMQEVNEIAQNLWTQTYKGQDIDGIEIRADEAGKKSYNYRLLMKKGGVDLDMRGRCSAGQKVLASLVIRLALAETFCLNCGILALDEPTTNLDVENVKSLCDALKDIIIARRGQDNFQLIIITHDEDFMEELAREAGMCDTYYRVSKDVETLCSKIEQQDLVERL